jgi:large subunit ribosomal protein L24
MKNKFSSSWKASKQPRKQRKYVANAPIHQKKKLVSVNLSKTLRKTQGKRNMIIKKGDTVKVMRGKFKKKQGKILEVKLKKVMVTVDGIQIKKQDGSKINVNLRPSNLQIVELNTDTKRAKGSKKIEKKEMKKSTKKQTEKTK